MSTLLFLAALTMLLLEGWLIARLFTDDRVLRFSFALPLAALANVMVFFVMTVMGIPLSVSWIVVGHLLVMCCAALVQRLFWTAGKYPCADIDRSSAGIPARGIGWFPFGICLLIILSTFFYSFTHALLLPTFQYDAATNWIGRSKVSFLEERIVFENAAPRDLIRKPHYPFLLHAWHLAANLGQPQWNDRAANALAFFLSWSMMLGIGALVAGLRGRFAGLLAVALLLSVPLLAVHLGEGYADHTLALFAGLSFLCFANVPQAGTPAADEKDMSLQSLSGLFAAAAVWTKAEGLFFVFLPWLVVILMPKFFSKECHPEPVEGRHDSPNVMVRQAHHDTFGALIIACLLALPWPLFAFLRGLSLTPHGSSDLLFGWRPESLRPIVESLFLSGSFGVLWYLLPVGLLTMRQRSADRRLLLFGVIPFAMILLIYTFTPNAEYLQNAQSFDRQMLTPAVLLLLALFV